MREMGGFRFLTFIRADRSYVATFSEGQMKRIGHKKEMIKRRRQKREREKIRERERESESK